MTNRITPPPLTGDQTAAMIEKTAAMSLERKEARVQAIYAMPDSEMTADVVDELGQIMTGKSRW